MRCVEPGDTVKVDYVCMIGRSIIGTSIKRYAKEASIFNKANKYGPLCFKLGSGKVIDGFEKALYGMKAGEEKTVAISSGDAYGKYRKELVREYPRSLFEQQGLKLWHGMVLKMNLKSGPLRAAVVDLNEKNVTLDMNHEYADKTLIFKIILKGIE